MYILAFDTTAASCSVVLLSENEILDTYSKLMEFGQSEELIPAIKDILAKNKISFSELEAIFLCVGPGSFTGVRASISAAKVFNLAQPKMIVSGFSAFDAYVQMLEMEEIAQVNAVIIETRRDDFYVRLYDAHLCPISEPQALDRGAAISILKKKNTPVTLIGDGVERFLSVSSGLTLHAIKICDSLTSEGIAASCWHQITEKKFNFPKPLYIRAADVSLK